MAGSVASRLRMQLNREAGLAELDKIVLKYGVVNGRPFTFDDHEFQIDIIRDTRSRQAVRKCSQVGLSELMVQKTLALAAVMKHTRAIFTLPTQGFAMSFSKDRFDSAIEGSDFYDSLVQKANNSASQKKIGSFTLYVAGSFGSNQAISVPAEIVINDEVDFSNDVVLGKLSSRLRHAEMEDERGYRGMRMKFSTPTVHDFGIDKDFEAGHQAYYMVKCTHCQKWTVPHFLTDFYIPGYDDDINNLRSNDVNNPRFDFDEAKIRCPECRGDLWKALCDPTLRQWVAKRPDVWEHSYQVNPWDAPKYNPPAVVLRQIADYPLISDFYNFVLGLPYSDSDNTFNTEQDYRDRISDIDIWMYQRTVVTVTTVAGMDIGKTCHFVVLARVGKHSHVVYAEKLENSRNKPATPVVLDRLKYFKVTRMCIDAGPDLTLVNQLVDARPFISAVVYVRSIKGIAIYEEKEEGRVINADRTKTLSELLGKHNSGEMRYPRQEGIKEEIFAHLATTKKIRERSADGSMIERFIKTKSEDHWVHALNYANIAAMVSDYAGMAGVIGALGVGGVRVGSKSQSVMDQDRRDRRRR